MRVTVTVPDSVGEEAEEAARAEGLSVSALFAEAVEAFLERRRRLLAVERIEEAARRGGVGEDALRILQEERAGADRGME